MSRVSDFATVLAVATVAFVSGCGGGDSTSSADTLLPPEQVTFGNYQTGVLAFADCLEAEGHPLLQLYQRVDDPRLYFYEVTLEGDGTSCYDDHLAPIDQAWQMKLEQERRANPEQDPEYQQLLRCSRGLGRPSASQGSLRDILEDFANNDIELTACIDQSPSGTVSPITDP